MHIDRVSEMRWFRNFVRESRWQFAKTYVTTYPHEYMLDKWCDDGSFLRAIRCIEHWGVSERFFDAHRKYFYVDGRAYWHMGDPTSADPEDQPGLINRSWTDVARYREDAKLAGIEEEHLDQAVMRWKMLLDKAKGRR